MSTAKRQPLCLGRNVLTNHLGLITTSVGKLGVFLANQSSEQLVIIIWALIQYKDVILSV